jgi:hypothetical protein
MFLLMGRVVRASGTLIDVGVGDRNSQFRGSLALYELAPRPSIQVLLNRLIHFFHGDGRVVCSI